MIPKAWLAVAAAVIGLLGAEQVTQGDLLHLARSVFRAMERDAPRATPSHAPAGEAFSGHPRIIDGDTFDLDGLRVRLQGIDALEHDQNCNWPGGGRFACGAEARQALVSLIGGQVVTCVPDGSTTHGRTVANCTVPGPGGGTLDLNRAMVRSGFAFDCPRFSHGRHAAAEREAREAGEGAWAGRFQYPWSFRNRAGACGR